MKNTIDTEIRGAIRKIRSVNTPNAIWDAYQIRSTCSGQISYCGKDWWPNLTEAKRALKSLRAITEIGAYADSMKIVRCYFIEEEVVTK